MAMVITKKVLGNGVTPPLLGKIPKKYRFFFLEDPPYDDNNDDNNDCDNNANNDDNNDVQGWGACATYTQSAPPFIYWLQPDWEHLPSVIMSWG